MKLNEITKKAQAVLTDQNVLIGIAAGLGGGWFFQKSLSRSVIMGGLGGYIYSIYKKPAQNPLLKTSTLTSTQVEAQDMAYGLVLLSMQKSLELLEVTQAKDYERMDEVQQYIVDNNLADYTSYGIPTLKRQLAAVP